MSRPSPLLLPRAYLLRWRGSPLVYRPLAGTVEWSSQCLEGTEEQVEWQPPRELRPRCLTVAWRGACNLACLYCYGAKETFAPTAAGVAAVTAAARVVATSCRDLGLPLLVGFHGSSEPLNDRRRVEELITALRDLACQERIPLHLAVTTSGVLGEAGASTDAEWIADTFDSVTISLDGPAALHNRQRPLRCGQGSAGPAEHTLRKILRSPQRPQHVAIRSTITRYNAQYQTAMAQYFLDTYGVDRLLFHPVYAGRGDTRCSTLSPDPVVFVRHFLQARQLARRCGCELVAADARVNDLHGRHCPILQHNLTLTPAGSATSCFLALDDHAAADRRLLYGGYSSTQDEYQIDAGRLGRLLQVCSRPDPQCVSCFNLRHCAQSCPTSCPFENPGERRDCRVPLWIGYATLLEAAGVKLTAQDLGSIEELFPLPVSEEPT